MALGGCVEQAAEIAPDVAAQRPMIAKREGMNLSDATIAVVSVEGAPTSISQDFAGDLAEAAKSRDISIVGTGAAHYLVRGDLSATPTEDGAQVE